jgi:uncharacterized membrane protein (DUF4010 family)
VVIACLGFMNYVLLRVYGSKGIYFTAILGLVNSTASVAELSSTLSATGLVSLTVPVVLLTSVAMFFRNVLILATFAHSAIRTAAIPLLAMAAIAVYWIYRNRNMAGQPDEGFSLRLASPVSLRKVMSFALLFLVVQALATLGQRLLGSTGFQIVSVLGGLVSSASTAAASANMALHGKVTSAQAGMAVVLISMASALVDLPIVVRQAQNKLVTRDLAVFPAASCHRNRGTRSSGKIHSYILKASKPPTKICLPRNPFRTKSASEHVSVSYPSINRLSVLLIDRSTPQTEGVDYYFSSTIRA